MQDKPEDKIENPVDGSGESGHEEEHREDLQDYKERSTLDFLLKQLGKLKRDK